MSLQGQTALFHSFLKQFKGVEFQKSEMCYLDLSRFSSVYSRSQFVKHDSEKPHMPEMTSPFHLLFKVYLLLFTLLVYFITTEIVTE